MSLFIEGSLQILLLLFFIVEIIINFTRGHKFLMMFPHSIVLFSSFYLDCSSQVELSENQNPAGHLQGKNMKGNQCLEARQQKKKPFPHSPTFSDAYSFLFSSRALFICR